MKFDDVKQFLIAEADRMGLDAYEIYFMEGSSSSAETLKDEISSFSSVVRGGVSFRCIVDGRMGSASSELFEEDEMRALVFRAIENAKNIESDDKAILFEGSDKYEDLDIPISPKLDAARLKAIALEMQKNTYDTSEYISDGTQSAVFCGETKIELINSKGLRLSNSVSNCGAYVCSVIQKDGEAQDGFEWTLDIEGDDLKSISEKATKNAMDKLGGVSTETGKYDIIISGKRMRDLLSAYSSAFSAKQAQLGMSRLRGKEGEKIAADIITVIDDPMREGTTVQTNFDGEGVATYKKSVIENGVLTTLLYDLTTADKAGRKSTGNGQRGSYSSAVNICPYNFYIKGGEKSFDELLGMLKDGLYITEFKGMHAGCNSVTGDFSIESAGFRVRDGKICEAVKAFTVAGNFFDVIKNIECISNDVSFGMSGGFTCFGSPDVLLRGASIAGK